MLKVLEIKKKMKKNLNRGDINLKNKKVTIKDIRESLYDANLDTEYREAMANSIMVLGYVSDSPLNLHFGTEKQKQEIQRVETMALDSNQISEIMHLMMYQMRNDFQYGRFKPVASKYLDISEKMKNANQKGKEENRVKEKIKCNIYGTFGTMIEIIGVVSKTLKENNMLDEPREMIERATKTYSYDEAFDIINEYVETIDRKENEEEEDEQFE